METLRSYRFAGDDAELKMQDVMKMLRYGFKTIGGLVVEEVHAGEAVGTAGGLGHSIEYRLAGGTAVKVRPSEDGSVLELRISAAGESDEEAAAIESRVRSDLESIIYMDHGMGYCCE